MRNINICQTSHKDISNCAPLWHRSLAFAFQLSILEDSFPIAGREHQLYFQRLLVLFPPQLCFFVSPSTYSSRLKEPGVLGSDRRQQAGLPAGCAIAWQLHPSHPALPQPPPPNWAAEWVLPILLEVALKEDPILCYCLSQSCISRVCHLTVCNSWWLTNLCCRFTVNCCYSRTRDAWLNSRFHQSF